jgi:hypothetical protein
VFCGCLGVLRAPVVFCGWLGVLRVWLGVLSRAPVLWLLVACRCGVVCAVLMSWVSSSLLCMQRRCGQVVRLLAAPSPLVC